MTKSRVRMVYNNIPKVTPAAEKRAEKAIATTTREIQNHIKAGMRGPKSGRSYRRGSIKRTGKAYAGKGLRSGAYASGKKYFVVGAKVHRASAPGESPAIDTAHYVNSWFVKWTGHLRAIVATNAAQARALELGRRGGGGLISRLLGKGGGGGMAARPHLRPAVDAIRPKFIERMKRIFK